MNVTHHARGQTLCAVAIPGTDVIAHMRTLDATPFRWEYSLWDENADETGADPIATGVLDMSDVGPGPVASLVITPEQAARIAFLLEVEYKS